jgi:alpha-N-arabinofuranosidase
VNPHVTETRTVELGVRGVSPAAGRAVVLSAPDIHAHNTFDQPRHVQAREQRMEQPPAGIVVHELPPASVTRITFELK